MGSLPLYGGTFAQSCATSKWSKPALLHSFAPVIIRNLPEPPTPSIFSKVSPGTNGTRIVGKNGRRIASKNGRCTAGFPFLQSLAASKAQRYKWGGVLRYKLEVYRQYFSDTLYGLGVPRLHPQFHNFLSAMNIWRHGTPRYSEGTEPIQNYKNELSENDF